MTSWPFARAASMRATAFFDWPHTPTVASLMWEMSSGRPPFSEISDRLVERLEALVGLVADVGHVEAAAPGGGLRELDELVGRGIAADVVLEARGQAERALGHPLLDEGGHLRDLLGRGLAPEVLAHHEAAHGLVADHRHHVDRGRRLLALREVLGDRPGRVAVGPEDERRDALRDLRLGERIGLQAVRRVVVHVDEARREDEPLAPDDPFALLRRELADLGDPVAFDADVARP